MLTVISPAKRLDWSETSHAKTTPIFERESQRLAAHGRALTLSKLKSLMDLSDDLARLNRERFQAFSDDPKEEDTRPALFAFAGDTYIGFDARSLDKASIDRAQQRLRILSGLYGVLKPLDAIQPYRLEMGSRLKTRRGSNLYDFWGEEIARALNADAEATDSDILVNCASQEYFGAIDLKRLDLRVITPQFYEVRNGTPKMISFFAKKARGAMARFIVENDVRDLDGLETFNADGYAFTGRDGDTLRFERAEEAKAA